MPYPAPEAIDGKRWTITPSYAARVDLAAREMFVPPNDDPQWANVRAHELAHVAFSKPMRRLPKGVTWETMQAVEDYRVNTLAYRAGVKFTHGSPTAVMQGVIAGIAVSQNLKTAVLLSLAAFPPERIALREQVVAVLTDDATREFCKYVVTTAGRMFTARPTRTTLSWRRGVKVARWIDQQLDQFKPATESGKTSDVTPEDAETGDNGGCAQSGRMTVQTPALTRAHALARSVRHSDEGAVLRAPWRMTTDQRVFRHVSVAKRAAVLIDCSGSMHLTDDDIRKIVTAVPAGVIAGYSGSSNKGILRILARNGKLTTAPADYDFPGCNVIDVPALKWLARQAGPRYWVCDGIVTGIDDQIYSEVNAACAHTVTSARIQQFRSAPDLITFLKRGKR